MSRRAPAGLTGNGDTTRGGPMTETTMTEATVAEIAQRYRRRADVFDATVAAVGTHDWDRPSPCAEWDARDVVRHVVDMHHVMLRPYAGSAADAPTVDDDPLAAFRAARSEVEAIL